MVWLWPAEKKSCFWEIKGQLADRLLIGSFEIPQTLNVKIFYSSNICQLKDSQRHLVIIKDIIVLKKSIFNGLFTMTGRIWRRQSSDLSLWIALNLLSDVQVYLKNKTNKPIQDFQGRSHLIILLFCVIVELSYLPADSRCVSECLIHETVLFPILDTLQLSVAILPSIAVTLPDFDSMNFGEWTTSALLLIITIIQYRILGSLTPTSPRISCCGGTIPS